MLPLPQTESSLWRESYRPGQYGALERNMHVDTVVVGGGILGLTTAYLLKRSGQNVVVLEKDTIGGGTTGYTTGKVTSQHGQVYVSLVKRHGETAARHYAQANEIAIGLIETIIKNEKIECGWQRDDNYVYTDDEAQVSSFRAEAETAARLGLPAEFTAETPLPFGVRAAVRFRNQAQFNAQAYVQGLARAVHGEGSYVFEHSQATKFRDGEEPHVSTSEATVDANAIVVATNVPTSPLMARGLYCAFEYPNTSYIVAGKLPTALQGMYISPDTGHYSILPVTYEGTPMILIGGESHLTGLRINKKKSHEKLAAYAAKHFGVTEITHRWSARDYLAYDEIPLVGKLYPWSRHLFTGTAFKKWGMTNTAVSAILLHDMVLGKDNEWAETFRTNRPSAMTAFPSAIPKEFKKLF